MSNENNKIGNPEAEAVGEESFQEEEVFDFSEIGATVKFVSKGPKVHKEKRGEVVDITLNREKFPDMAAVHRAGVLELAQATQLRRALKEDAKGVLEFAGEKGMARILQLQGLKHLKNEVSRIGEGFEKVEWETLSLTGAFDRACERYIVDGRLSDDVPEEVASAFDSIPKVGKGIHKGFHVLDALSSEKYTRKIEQKLFGAIARAREELRKKEVADTEKFEYKPQIGAGETEPVDPESIEKKVTPFYGGYYRGYACHFEPDMHQIVQEKGQAVLFETPDEIQHENLKKYTYETVFNPAKDNLIELPYNAIPLTDTITPSTLGIFKSENGTFYLRKKSKKEEQEKQPVSFEFVIDECQSDEIKDEPDRENEEWGTLDAETEDFVNSLKEKSASVLEKSRACAKYVRGNFKYPEDESARAEMNGRYLSAGDTSLAQMCEHKVADCYWSNIFFGQLLARLGIQHRVIAGYYVQKDPRFEFAALAGIGHAWSEVWNGESWQRIDATPPKEKQEDEQEQEEEQEPQDGDFGEDEVQEEEPQEELSPEEIRELYEELIKEESDAEKPPTPEELFEEKTGVPLAKWREVERYIESVNKTEIPAESSIDSKESTLRGEWDKLFELLYKRRKIPVEAFRGPVRQSEGEELEDPVDATIDLISGESDPMGYKLRAQKTKEHVEVTSFEDDAILDLTASMTGTPVQEQKKMLLSGLHNLMMMSRRLNLDKYKKKMKDPLELRSRVYTFKGQTQVDQVLDTEEIIDEKSLCRLYDELDKIRMGYGNLAGALKAYEDALTEKQITRIKAGKLVKVLTVVSDGEVANQGEAIRIIRALREKGIIVQGIGFGDQAQDIRVICRDPRDENAGVVIKDVRKAVITRHSQMSKALRKL